jgi:hypothetical protein
VLSVTTNVDKPPLLYGKNPEYPACWREVARSLIPETGLGETGINQLADENEQDP